MYPNLETISAAEASAEAKEEIASVGTLDEELEELNEISELFTEELLVALRAKAEELRDLSTPEELDFFTQEHLGCPLNDIRDYKPETRQRGVLARFVRARHLEVNPNAEKPRDKDEEHPENPPIAKQVPV